MFGVELATPGTFLDFGARLPDDLAHLKGNDSGIMGGVMAQLGGGVAEQPCALGEWRRLPDRVDRRRAGKRGFHLTVVPRIEGFQPFAGGRIDRFHDC